MSSDPSAVAGVRARIEAAQVELTERAELAASGAESWTRPQDGSVSVDWLQNQAASWRDRTNMAAALLAVLDLADDAETVPWPMDYALVSVDDLRAAVVAAFQPTPTNGTTHVAAHQGDSNVVQ
jgi:hypothetical protein